MTRHPRLLTALALLACLTGLAAAAAGEFTVRQVTVIGRNLPGAEIIQAADVIGQNTFAVRSDQVAARLAGIPAIEVSRVETDFPDRVTIYASVRRPAIGWRSGAGLQLVDPHGIVIRPAATTVLPVISGGTRPPNANVILAARYAASVLPATPSGTVAGFRQDPTTGLTISGTSGWTAAIGAGGAQALVTRVATLAALFRRLGPRAAQVSFIDLRYREPYLRFRGG